jgi:signal transduction histidine kinase
MAPHEIKIALTPFGQIHNAQSRKHSGTGLGLPLAKAMMEMHAGSLRVVSAPGHGTTVSLLFPPERVVARPESGTGSPDGREQSAPQAQAAGGPDYAQRVA